VGVKGPEVDGIVAFGHLIEGGVKLDHGRRNGPCQGHSGKCPRAIVARDLSPCIFDPVFIGLDEVFPGGGGGHFHKETGEGRRPVAVVVTKPDDEDIHAVGKAGGLQLFVEDEKCGGLHGKGDGRCVVQGIFPDHDVFGFRGGLLLRHLHEEAAEGRRPVALVVTEAERQNIQPIGQMGGIGLHVKLKHRRRGHGLCHLTLREVVEPKFIARDKRWWTDGLPGQGQPPPDEKPCQEIFFHGFGITCFVLQP